MINICKRERGRSCDSGCPAHTPSGMPTTCKLVNVEINVRKAEVKMHDGKRRYYEGKTK